MLMGCGKRWSEPAVAALSSSRTLLAVIDSVSRREFLVDTGAEVSIIPATSTDRATFVRQPQRVLRAANGTSIRTYGTIDSIICIQGKKFAHTFIKADVQRALLGADFLLKHELLVDLPGRRILKANTLTAFECVISKADTVALGVSVNGKNVYWKMLEEFPRITQGDFATHVPLHGVEHHIVTEGPPVWSRARRLNTEKLLAAKKEFEHLLRMGIIQPSSSQWASPLHMVRKPNGEWRPCGDYRRLNSMTTPDRYPVPHVQDFNTQLNGSTVFSKIDLIRGYHQIPVAADDRPKTAVITPFGSYEFIRMPFGLCNAGQTFQRTMHTVLRNLPRVYVYIDDVLIASRNKQEHLDDLQEVFRRLQEHGLLIRPDKCDFGRDEITFLGYNISSQGIQPLPDRVQAILEYPLPETAKKLQKFLGMINFYHRFIPRASVILRGLHTLSRSRPSTKQLAWSEDDKKSFNEVKHLLSRATLLAFPRENAELGLSTDASDKGMGAVLEQRVRGVWQPLAFFSRAIDSAQTKYSAFDRELLAAHTAAQHFGFMLDGRTCILFTDHKPLTHAWKRVGDPWSARQQRHLSTLAETFVDVRHKEGKHNVVADTLSRDLVQGVYQGISPSRLHEEQANDDYIQTSRTAITNLQLRDTELDGSIVLCDVSKGYPRPLVPPNLRREIFDIFHNLSHPGARTTTRLVANEFVWHNLKRDVAAWCSQCERCQCSKVQRHTKSAIPCIPVPDKAFIHVHLDIVGPLPQCQGFNYLLTILDRYSRWPEAVPLKGITADECASAFIANWVARHGVPRHITSDRGRQFVSHVWQKMADSMQTKLHYTTPYHPQANGLVERLHRTMKAALRARLTNTNWLKDLPWVMLGLRTSLKEDLGKTPAELIYRHQLNLPGSVVDTGVPPGEHHGPTTVKHHDTPVTYIPKGLMTAKSVWVRNDAVRKPLDTPYTGPYPVIQRNEKFFIIRVFGQERPISVDRLKPATTHDDETSERHQKTRSGRISKPPTRFSSRGGGVLWRSSLPLTDVRQP